jgi:hypothetical protein
MRKRNKKSRRMRQGRIASLGRKTLNAEHLEQRQLLAGDAFQVSAVAISSVEVDGGTLGVEEGKAVSTVSDLSQLTSDPVNTNGVGGGKNGAKGATERAPAPETDTQASSADRYRQQDNKATGVNSKHRRPDAALRSGVLAPVGAASLASAGGLDLTPQDDRDIEGRVRNAMQRESTEKSPPSRDSQPNPRRTETPRTAPEQSRGTPSGRGGENGHDTKFDGDLAPPDCPNAPDAVFEEWGEREWPAFLEGEANPDPIPHQVPNDPDQTEPAIDDPRNNPDVPPWLKDTLSIAKHLDAVRQPVSYDGCEEIALVQKLVNCNDDKSKCDIETNYTCQDGTECSYKSLECDILKHTDSTTVASCEAQTELVCKAPNNS